MLNFLKSIFPYAPDDSSAHISATFYVDDLIKRSKSLVLLDLGCGSGATLKYFKKLDPTITWHGIDLPSSPEVDIRKNVLKTNENIIDYDGIHIPYSDNFFDVVFFNQVLEHVVFPQELFKEIYRVLKPNGFLIGSVSYMEFFHSNSTFNVTPYGIIKLAEIGKLELLEMRPGPDCIGLFLLVFLNPLRLFTPVIKFLVDTFGLPLNSLISIFMRLLGKSHKEINVIKLFFAGHIRFKMIKHE